MPPRTTGADTRAREGASPPFAGHKRAIGASTRDIAGVELVVRQLGQLTAVQLVPNHRSAVAWPRGADLDAWRCDSHEVHALAMNSRKLVPKAVANPPGSSATGAA